MLVRRMIESHHIGRSGCDITLELSEVACGYAVTVRFTGLEIACSVRESLDEAKEEIRSIMESAGNLMLEAAKKI